MQDSPVGVRDTDYNSVFPSGQTAAATFDRTLMYQRGLAMGQEHKGKGVTVQLGPVAGPLGRAPEGGRNWEGFSYVLSLNMWEGIADLFSGLIRCSLALVSRKPSREFRMRVSSPAPSI